MTFNPFDRHHPNNPFGLEEGPSTAPGHPLERMFPQPTNPNRGPYIGRSTEMRAGNLNSSVIETNQCNLGDTLTVCLTQMDYPEAGEDPLDRTAHMALVAHINWRVGQHQDNCDVDWIRGTLLTIPSGNVTINCSYPKVDGKAQPRQLVGCLFSPLIRAGGLGMQSLARLTSSADLTGTGAAIPIPRRAQAFQLMLANATLYGTISITQQYNAGAGAGDPISQSVPLDDHQIPIVNGARSLLIAAAETTAFILWSIAL